MGVVVYIVSSNPHSDQARRVRELFSHFETRIVNIASPNHLDYLGQLNESEKLEVYQYFWCLKEAREEFPESHVLVVKDTTTSSHSSSKIRDVLSDAIKRSWDLLYLCRWMDQCETNTDEIKLGSHGISMIQTKSPYGTQAVLVSPETRDWLISEIEPKINSPLGQTLNDLVTKNQLKAYCFTNNLVDYDAAFSDGSDLYKLNKCRSTTSKHTSRDSWVGSRRRSTSLTDDCSTGTLTVEAPVNCKPDQGYSVAYYIIVVAFIMLIIVLFAFYEQKY